MSTSVAPANLQAGQVDGVRSDKWMLWVGWVLTAGPVLLLAMSAGMKLTHSAQLVENFTVKFGFTENTLLALGLVELACVVLYAIPRTAVLGAILMTGYLGGAIATHVRVSEAFIGPLLFGVLAWGGLFLRDERLRALLPLRSPAPPAKG
ncbi:MAG: DoxX family protein [Myxococcaceae bacterium]